MRRSWMTMSVLLWACASGRAPEPMTAAHAREQQRDGTLAASRVSYTAPGAAAFKARGANKAKTSSATESCTPLANVAPKTVTGEGTASDAADTGRTLIFDVAGIALELPACTPDADVRVITVSWDTKGRPNPARIHPKFTRHAATLRVDQAITSLADAPLLVWLHSKRELTKVGEKLVLAVESSGECDAQHKHDKLEDGECSHWQLFDTTFDAQRNEMVARIPATGGYRLQFGWVPAR